MAETDKKLCLQRKFKTNTQKCVDHICGLIYAERQTNYCQKSYENRLKTDVLRRFLVRVGRLELPASCSQSKRATNCATPGYEIFQLWSNMGSMPVFDQLPARGKTPSALASQSFPGFWRSAARTPASRSQSRRATNCATPGYKAPAATGGFFIIPSFIYFFKIYFCKSCLIFVVEISGVRGRYTTSHFSFRKSNFPVQSSPIQKTSIWY